MHSELKLAQVVPIMPVTARLAKKSPAPNTDSVLLPISVGSKNYEGDYFGATADFAARTYKKATILLCDSLKRFTYAIEAPDKSTSPEDCFEMALNEGINWKDRNRATLDDISRRCELEVIHWEDVRNSDDFETMLPVVKHMYDSDAGFVKAVVEGVNNYANHQDRRLGKAHRALSEEYILEETTGMSCSITAQFKEVLYAGDHPPSVVYMENMRTSKLGGITKNPRKFLRLNFSDDARRFNGSGAEKGSRPIVSKIKQFPLKEPELPLKEVLLLLIVLKKSGISLELFGEGHDKALSTAKIAAILSNPTISSASAGKYRIRLRQCGPSGSTRPQVEDPEVEVNLDQIPDLIDGALSGRGGSAAVQEVSSLTTAIRKLLPDVIIEPCNIIEANEVCRGAM